LVHDRRLTLSEPTASHTPSTTHTFACTSSVDPSRLRDRRRRRGRVLRSPPLPSGAAARPDTPVPTISHCGRGPRGRPRRRATPVRAVAPPRLPATTGTGLRCTPANERARTLSDSASSS
jgi:hypothetical protein